MNKKKKSKLRLEFAKAGENAAKKCTVNVYLDDGRVIKYRVEDPIKAREHAHRIVTKGWRNTTNGMMEYYPVHQVLKVTFKSPGDKLDKKYQG